MRASAHKAAGKGKSKPVYSNFKKFYDYKKAIKEAINPDKNKEKFSGIAKLLRKGGNANG